MDGGFIKINTEKFQEKKEFNQVKPIIKPKENS